ncbi:unnamed protein product [Eretmochelys imbricata]
MLAPALFNIYINYMPPTKSRKFGYADDLARTIPASNLPDIEKALTEDLNNMEQYFWKWRLKPNPGKTIVSTFHLDKQSAKNTLKVVFCGKNVQHDDTPTYLGVKLDRTLSFHDHLEKVAGKIKTRANRIQKLAGTTWGPSASLL